MEKPIYLDNHATTKLDPRVLEAMLPWLGEKCGNPTSRSHRHGWMAEEAVEQARVQIADFVGAQPSEIIFTSSATESNNTVINGVNCGIITTKIEHKSILVPCELALSSGRQVALANVNSDGIVDLNQLLSLIDKNNKLLVSVMMANNEVGSIQPIEKLVKMVPDNVLVHSDMAQAIGKIPVNLKELGVHFASFSAHKMYGPKGIGALYIRENWYLTPLIYGGGQEQGLRSGTLNVPAIVGFGKACEIAKSEMFVESNRILLLRDKFLDLIRGSFPNIVVHGGTSRLPNNLNFSIPHCDINSFMAYVADEISLSLGSACMSNSESSYVLEAMGVSKEDARCSVRIGFGKFNTEEEIVEAGKAIVVAIEKSKEILNVG